MKFFNTLSGRLEEFKPLADGEVKMYTCGPTVYDYAHIGNFRAFVFEDLLRRFLEFQGFKVKHVMNLTDVDDKTIAGANKNVGAPLVGALKGQAQGLPLQRLNEFTEKYIHAFQEDLNALNILPPNYPKEQPRATREIPAMIDLIQKLIKKEAAYVSEGSVYYRVSAFPDYGKLSKKDLKRNLKGARVDVDEYDKEEGADFVLWKKSKEGEPSWESPWGKGRPGWHIECSAMSMKYLGETFDIHAGGEDLVFPHHENEIAQSEAATGKPFVKYWLHCKHLLVNGEKMSKSKGNFYTLRDLLAKGYDPMAIRFALLSVHYRQPLNFTLEGLKDSAESVRKLDDCYYQCVSRLKLKLYAPTSSGYEGIPGQILDFMGKNLADDLNVAACLSTLLSGVSKINTFVTQMNEKELKDCVEFFDTVDKLLGLNIADPEGISNEILKMIRQRAEVRLKIKEQNDKSLWKTSDELRDKIQERGWVVKDGKPGELSILKKKRRAWD